MTTPYKGNYGYGFVVSKDSNMISHTGKSTSIMPLSLLQKTKIKFI